MALTGSAPPHPPWKWVLMACRLPFLWIGTIASNINCTYVLKVCTVEMLCMLLIYFQCPFVAMYMNCNYTALGIMERDKTTALKINGTSATYNKVWRVSVCVWTIGLIVWVFVLLLYIQPACVCVCVWRCREQSRTTGLRLHCYTSNELPGASAFLMKPSLWSLLYLIPVGQVLSSLLPISTAAI